MLAISPQLESEAAVHLLQCWRNWSRALTRSADAEHLSSSAQREYHERHGAVLEAIERRRREVGDDPLLRKLEGLVQPWVNLEAFRLAPDSIRKDLLNQCRHCEFDLCGYKRRGTTIPWRKVLIAAALSLASAYLLVDFWLFETQSVLASIQYQLLGLGYWIRHWSLFEKFAAAVLAMLCIGWCMTQHLRAN